MKQSLEIRQLDDPIPTGEHHDPNRSHRWVVDRKLHL